MTQNTIDLTIAHRSYKMVVEEGQESRLNRVADLLNERITQLRNGAGDMERDRLLVLAGMMLADDLMTSTAEKTQQEESVAAFNNTLAQRITDLIK